MGTINDLKARFMNICLDFSWSKHEIESARRWIFEHGAAPEGTHVEAILGEKSITPSRLSVWKATFTHLFRILISAGGKCVQELNNCKDTLTTANFGAQLSQIPTFGRDTICRFGHNISGSGPELYPPLGPSRRGPIGSPAEPVATEAALRRAEAAEREAEKAKQMKKRTATKPRSTGTAGREDWEEKAATVSYTPCRKASAACRFFTSGRSAACVRFQEKKAKCEGGSPPEGVRSWKWKTKDTVDSDLEELEAPPKKKKSEEALKAGPSKGKEWAHPEPEPEVEKARPKKIAVAEGSLDTRELFLRVLQEVSACRSKIRKLRPDMVSLQEEMADLQEEL
ncbi:hypothetical protein OH76DRAFT_1422445 [Lentinus brumalis]|uniref:Uncharacterized protein n=1 Tax=Lentinus brumalis TaxID=2498619 RepID=A0A371CQF6_9APHY|nr:hypothetical protein OH76DRAFT_1422445 [Polyporus brumalis]